MTVILAEFYPNIGQLDKFAKVSLEVYFSGSADAIDGDGVLIKIVGPEKTSGLVIKGDDFREFVATVGDIEGLVKSLDEQGVFKKLNEESK